MSSQYIFEQNNEKLLEKIKKRLKEDDPNVSIMEEILSTGKHLYLGDNVLTEDNMKVLNVTTGDNKQKFSIRCVTTKVINITDEQGNPKAIYLSDEEVKERAKNPSHSRDECFINEDYITRKMLKKFKRTLKDKEIDLTFDEDMLLTLGRE